MKLYRVLLEIQPKSGIKHLPRYVQANDIKEAWLLANNVGASYNLSHRSKCVVYSVNFHEALTGAKYNVPPRYATLDSLMRIDPNKDATKSPKGYSV